MVLIGLFGAFWGLLRGLGGGLTGVPAAAGLVALAIAIIWVCLRIQSAHAFLLFATACWLLTRGAIVVLFPKFVLPGDERYFHEFVTRLVSAMAHGNISSLSNIYDFPVWLARSFPFYLPLAELFGPNDTQAARWLNVLLGAGQLICLFFVTRRLLGRRAARLSCLLLLVFPYHSINVLSYDPQIAGTFFLLLAVWLVQCLNRRASHSISSLMAIGTGLALSLMLAGIQRGGIDLLLIAAMLLVAVLPTRTGLKTRIVSSNAIPCLIALCLLWLPLRFAFDHWVASQDSHSLRSHTLGFMTRGWNLDTAGEYLPLYEELDIAAAKAEKQRTLEAILITEFAREPIRSLLVLVPVKTAKFLAIGYASTAEQGLTLGGYSAAASIYRILRSLYAPLILGLSLLGLVRCWQSPRLQRRLILPVLLVVLSCAAIVLIWETSPRYSHPIQFALLILATLGMAGFPRSSAVTRLRPRLLLEFATSGAALTCCWLFLSICIVGVARSATKYQFLDPRALSASLGETKMEIEPLHPFSSSWEGAITLPVGTVLPATLRIAFPYPHAAGWDHLSVSLWLPDNPVAGQSAYQISCPAFISSHITRIQVRKPAKGPTTLTLSISSAIDTRIRSQARVGIGYLLAN